MQVGGEVQAKVYQALYRLIRQPDRPMYDSAFFRYMCELLLAAATETTVTYGCI